MFVAPPKGTKKQDRTRNLRTVILTGSLLVVFALAGQQLFFFFGIFMYSFMIAGGILLLLLSIEIPVKKWMGSGVFI